jgi:CRISPR-associated protein Cas1
MSSESSHASETSAPKGAVSRMLIKITRESLPQVKDKYPFIYLERGRLEIDDSSVKWIDSDKNIVRLPIATINCVLLGLGTTVTHEAVKVVSQSNCSLCWVGEDSLLFYASGQSPSSSTRNLREQVKLSADPKKSVEVARRMFARRFPDAELNGKSLKEMMGMEGHRVRSLYEQKAEQYGVGWNGRRFAPGKFEMSDLTNQILTSCNAALYGVIASCVHSMGYSPHIGFIHSGSPLPFVYDLADLYKEYICIDLSFSLTLEMSGKYNKHVVSTMFRKRVIETDLLGSIGQDIEFVLKGKEVTNACSNSQ